MISVKPVTSLRDRDRLKLSDERAAHDDVLMWISRVIIQRFCNSGIFQIRHILHL